MPLSNIELVMPDPDTYGIRINEYQRAVLQKCLNHTLHTMPTGMWKNADEKRMAEGLHDMLNPSGTCGPLCTLGINSFVV